jgi:hypothetical protein
VANLLIVRSFFLREGRVQGSARATETTDRTKAMARKMPTWAKQAASVVTILAAWFVLTIVTFDSVPDAVTLKAPYLPR